MGQCDIKHLSAAVESSNSAAWLQPATCGSNSALQQLKQLFRAKTVSAKLGKDGRGGLAGPCYDSCWTAALPVAVVLCLCHALAAQCGSPVPAGGSLQVIKGFDLAVTGLAVGESRKERIAPENAVSHAQETAGRSWVP